jgi:DNA-binding NtrC family response regulator
VPAPAQILLVEDKDSLRTMLRLALERQGHTVIEARDQPEAVRHLQQTQPSVVLSDLRLPDGDGFGVLRASKDIDPDVPVIVMTAHGSIEDAVVAMKEGAMDFLAKPVDPDHLLLLVARAVEQRRIVTEMFLMKEELAVRRGAPKLVTEDPALRKVYASLQRAATTDTTVLIEGESGTGKELFARSLHAFSPRADQPFVALQKHHLLEQIPLKVLH